MHSQNLQEYVDFLRRALPEEDRIALPDAALERVARHAMTVREATPWGRSIPEWIFRDYVLFPRVNDEFPEAWHAPIWESLRARLAGLSMIEAALEVNVWCAEHATYQSTDNRTAGPLTVLRRGCGRCGEESTLLTAALRAAGIPARQMYSPRWAHCDDNHAWVEAWLDGGWHYMGACEPEPEPDSGWFTAAASKAMLVHTRAFGEAPEGERVERKYGNFSIVNRTAAYARTRRVTVRVADGGCPLPGAAVRFELANMAELYPISEKITDARGEAELETGCGTLRIHATDGNRWLARTTDAERVEIDLKDGFSCEEKAAAEAPQTQKNRGKESDGTVCGGADAQAGEARERCAARSESEALRFADEKLCADVSSEALQKRDAAARENGDAAEDVLPPTERFVQRPPRETRIQPTVHSEAAARRHAETLRRCERMRAARSAELASDDADLARARGNAGEIRAFVSDARFAQADKRALLSTLREKDLADTSAETLMDALETALPVKTALPEAIWREAVLCPRIADEKLLPVRRALRQALGEGLCPSDEAARVDGESTAGIPAAREYAETAEAAALTGGADKASRCMGAAKTGENPASGIPISGETEHRHGEAVQSRACAVEATPEAQCQHAAQPEGCAGNEDSTGTLIADEATLKCSETRETTQSRACAAERAVSEAPRLHVTLPEAIPEHGQASGAALEGLPTFTARAAELWRRIEARVRPVHSDFPLVPDLRAALRAGRAAPMVRDILFVAAARACGIPARLNPAGGEKEVWDGAWRPLLPMERGRLRLTNPTGAPKVYGVDFTVGILENGAFRTLSFWGETLENLWEREVPAGVYRAVHCARQIDGSVDGELRYARVAPSGRAEIALEPLPDRTGEKLLRRRLPELRAEEILPEGAGAISSAMRRSEPRSEANHVESSLSMHAEGLRHEEPSSPLRTAQPMRESEPSSPTRAEGRTHGKDSRESSLTMRAAMAPGARQTLPKPGRASLLAVLDPGAEPTEHFLNEVLEIREEFRNIRLELLISRRSQCENARLAETLRAVPHARLWTDFDADALLEWRKALGAGDLRLPLAVAFDAQGEALFAFTNYNVGSVRSLLRCIAAAD